MKIISDSTSLFDFIFWEGGKQSHWLRGNVRIKLRQSAGFASRPGSPFAFSPTGLVLITDHQDKASSMCLSHLDKTIQVALKWYLHLQWRMFLSNIYQFCIFIINLLLRGRVFFFTIMLSSFEK